MPECNIGMKLETIEKLRNELDAALSKALNTGNTNIEVTLYGDQDRFGHVLTISNDDMEGRDEVPNEAIYVEVE